MYGIAAYDSAPLANGLKKANDSDWNSVEAAIIGGAHWIKENYAGNPEKNTIYKMKWQPTNPLELGQYATDVAWAIKQCDTIKKLYELFPDAELKFEIPEYVGSNLTYKDDEQKVEIYPGSGGTNTVNTVEYVVKGGDTLSKIARMYNTSVQELARFNNIQNVNIINVGQVIKIPTSNNTTSNNTTSNNNSIQASNVDVDKFLSCSY